jgi:hypothetical protein
MHANTSIWCVFCTCKALALINFKYFAHLHTTYFLHISSPLWGGLEDLDQDLMHANTSIWCVFLHLQNTCNNNFNTLHTSLHNIFLRISSPLWGGLEDLDQDLMHANTLIWCVFCTCKNTCNNNFKYLAHTFTQHISLLF